MSTAIGKDQSVPSPVGNPGLDAERKAEVVENDVRAQRFRDALSRQGANSAKPPATPAKPTVSSAADLAQAAMQAASKQAGKPQAQHAKEAAKKDDHCGHKVDDCHSKGSDKLQHRGDSANHLPMGLTEEQANAVSALGGHEGVARKHHGEHHHGEHGGQGHDDLATAGAGSARLAGKGKAQTPAEEVMTEVAAAVQAAAQAQHGGWNRPEGPARPEARARELPQPPAGTEAVHQLYMGKGPAGAEGRIMISSGPLAGTEIHLREGPGGVQASILTQTASSRQTLSNAIAAVTERLKLKGHTLDVRFGAPLPDARPPAQGQARPRG